MEAIAQVYYWIRLGLLVFIAILAIVTAIRQTRARAYSTVRGIALALGAVVGYVLLVWLSGFSVRIVWTVGLCAVGVVLGLLGGMTSKISRADGRLRLKRSPIGPWVYALGYILAAMTLLFGETSYIFGLALLILVFGVGLVVGQVSGEAVKSGRHGPPEPVQTLPSEASPPPAPERA